MTTSTSKGSVTTTGNIPSPVHIQHKGLPLSSDFALPRIAVRKRLAIIASTGAGKSYLSMVMIERMVEDGLPVVVIDPLGVYWGLRSSADGLGEGLPIIIFGGPRGDIALDPNAGSLVADVLVELRRPAILDLSQFANTRLACRFVADFLNGLRRYEKPRLHLVIDESDLFAPQTPKSPEAQLSYDAMDNLARRDRVKGLGATFITQRPASIAKDVISQVEALISLRLGGPQDIKALNGWFELHATPDQLAEYKQTVLTLPTGTAWVWSPAWLRVFRQITVTGRTTFDSSATPDVDEDEAPPAHLAPLDLASLGERMRVLAEQTSEDPSALKAKIARLEEDLRQERAGNQRVAKQGERRQEGTKIPTDRITPSSETSLVELQRQLTEAEHLRTTLIAENTTLQEQMRLLSHLQVTLGADALSSLVTLPTTFPIAQAIKEHVHLAQNKESSILLPPQASTELVKQMEHLQEQLSNQENRLTQKETRIEELQKENLKLKEVVKQVGAPVFRLEQALSTLQQASREVEQAVQGIQKATSATLQSKKAGVSRMEQTKVQSSEASSPSFSSTQALERTLTVPPGEEGPQQLRAGERKMLEVLARHYPMKVTRAQLGTLANYAASGGTFGTYLGTLKRQGFIAEPSKGEVTITKDGLSYLGMAQPPTSQTREEFIRMWRESLRAGERKMLNALMVIYPGTLTREELGLQAEMTPTGGTFGTYLGTLRRNSLIEVRGDTIRASDIFFDGQRE